MKENNKAGVEVVRPSRKSQPSKPDKGPGRYWIGLDLGDKVSRFCILNESSTVEERGSVGIGKEELKRKFMPYAGQVIALR